MSMLTLIVLILALAFVIFMLADGRVANGSQPVRKSRMRVFDDFEKDELKRYK